MVDDEQRGRASRVGGAGRAPGTERREHTADWLQRVLDQSRDALTVTSGPLVEWCSSAVEEIFGESAAELTGRDDLLDRVHPDDVPTVVAARDRLRNMETVEVRCRVRHTDGGWRWIDLRSRVMERGDGDCAPQVVASWRLVDHEVAHLEALAASEARNRELADQLQRALDSRVIIERAKGFIAGRDNVSFDEAFTRIRDHGRRHGRKVADVARDVTEHGLRL